MFSKKIIYGCEGRGDADQPYMTRYTLIDCKNWQLCIHVFHRSDADDLHDHPWNFLSIILWRGYYEETMKYKNTKVTWDYDNEDLFTNNVKCHVDFIYERKRKRVYPFCFLWRKAEHKHRVVLVDGKPAVTLVWMGKRRREWGFWTKQGWKNWIGYFIENKC